MSRLWNADARGLAARWTQLLLGLLCFGIAVPIMIRSGLGLGPWDAFHVGLSRLSGVSVGMATILVGLVIVVGSYQLRIKPGPGTVANMVLIGLFVDFTLPLVPPAQSLSMGFGYYLVAIPLTGLATGMYMGARLGNGPRDGLMLGLATANGWPIHGVRTAIELSALAAGWAMGGSIGIGTLIFALTIGRATQAGLRLFDVVPPPAAHLDSTGRPPPRRSWRRAA